MTAKKSKKIASHPTPFHRVIKGVVGLLVVLGIAGLGYSAYQYQTSEEEHVGFFVCNKEHTVCELSQHIHADIRLTACGTQVFFPKEKGRTDKQHTHKETNKLHWHAQLRVEPTTRAPLDPSLMSIQTFLDQMEYTFPQTCEQNPQPELKVEINGTIPDNGLSAIWKDGDQITITYQ